MGREVVCGELKTNDELMAVHRRVRESVPVKAFGDIEKATSRGFTLNIETVRARFYECTRDGR